MRRSFAYSSALNVAEPRLFLPASLAPLCECESVSRSLRFTPREPQAGSFPRLQVKALRWQRRVRVTEKCGNNLVLGFCFVFKSADAFQLGISHLENQVLLRFSMSCSIKFTQINLREKYKCVSSLFQCSTTQVFLDSELGC